MNWEYKNTVKITPVLGDYDGLPGVVIESIDLQSKLFGTWGPASTPERTIRDELAKAIADKLVIDVEWNKDPRSGHAVGKFSSVVYMKPDMKEMHENINNKDKDILRINKERLILEKANVAIHKEHSEAEDLILKLQVQNSKLNTEMNCKFNDYKFLIKQGLKMFWLEIKCEMYAMSRFIPFRG